MNLPERPEREAEQTQEEYEEILGFWMSRVGRLHSIAGRKVVTSKTSASEKTIKDSELP